MAHKTDDNISIKYGLTSEPALISITSFSKDPLQTKMPLNFCWICRY